MDKNKELWKVFSLRLRKVLGSMNIEFEQLQEIRLRVWEPLLIIYDNREFFVDENGKLTTCMSHIYIVTAEDIQSTLDSISQYSLYAYEDEIRQGFITIQGGHRVGIAGKVVMENGKIKTIRHISFLNIRLSHQVKGCGEALLPRIEGADGIRHTLIISPPRCGKTTLLRDLIRLISDGSPGRPGVTVGVVDERSEIGACYQGVPQNDVGMRTDVLDGCPKAEGMQLLIRSMSPTVVAVDELGKEEDFRAVESVIHCGCTLLATAHGNSLEDIMEQPFFQKLKSMQVFERYIILGRQKRNGRIVQILDGKGKPC